MVCILSMVDMVDGITKGNTADSHSICKAGGNEVKCFELEMKVLNSAPN